MGAMSTPTAPVPQHPQGPPPAQRDGWFSQATSTTGGRIAVVAAALFGTLLLMTGVGLVAALVGGVADGFGDDERVMMSDRDGPGNGRGMGLGLGQDKDKDKGNQGNGQGNGPGNKGQGNNGQGNGPENNGQGNGPGNNGQGMGRVAGGIDGVLHGEFTTNVTGDPTVMVVQSGLVTAYTPGTSLTVKSADGFEATYVLDATVATMRGAADLVVGAQVQVVAAKEGLKLTRLAVQ